MRFEVPQFIEIEDKIFGPFTWRQFVYLMGGGGIGLVLFLTTSFFIFVLIGLPVAGLAFLLAFYPINNRPFSVFLENAMKYFSSTRLYRWRKHHSAVYTNEPDKTGLGDEAATNFALPTSSGGLHSLSRQLELEAMQKDTN